MCRRRVASLLALAGVSIGGSIVVSTTVVTVGFAAVVSLAVPIIVSGWAVCSSTPVIAESALVAVLSRSRAAVLAGMAYSVAGGAFFLAVCAVRGVDIAYLAEVCGGGGGSQRGWGAFLLQVCGARNFLETIAELRHSFENGSLFALEPYLEVALNVIWEASCQGLQH